MHKLKQLFRQSITTLRNFSSDHLWNFLTYFGIISDSTKKCFNKYNINISFSNYNSFMSKLQNNKIARDIMTCSDIYNLTCNCGANYVGRPITQFKQRVSEHKHDFKYSIIDRSKFVAHLIKIAIHSVLKSSIFNIDNH